MSEGKTYDLAVIGSGTAAQVVSFRVRAAGWSVAVIDIDARAPGKFADRQGYGRRRDNGVHRITCRSAEPVPCAAAIRKRC
jgi:predicted NAD/FAD-dependent oxidoreductase